MARKKLQKFFALLLTFSLSMSLLSVGAFAAEGKTDLSDLAYDAAITVPFGTPEEDIGLPETLTGTVEQEEVPPAEVQVLETEQVAGTVEETPVPDVTEGVTASDTNEDADADVTDGDADAAVTDGDADTAVTDGDADAAVTDGDADAAVTDGDADTAVTDGDADTAVTDGDADADVTDGDADTAITDGDADADVTDGDADADVTGGDTADTGTVVLTAIDTKADPAPEETVEIPVNWTCDDYDGWTAGNYTFTADLGDYQYQNSTEVSVTVTVEEQAGMVARINDAEYPTFDAAVKAADDGDTIVLLGNCTTDGLNLSKNLTVTSEEGKTYTLNFVNQGIALWGKALTFENCDILMNGIGSTPYGEWTWMAICASKDASLTLNQATMTMDAEGVSNNPHAIYFCSNNQLNLNDSTLVIRNYPQDALEWDGGDGGYNINITDSTFISDHNRSGFTGTFYATIKNSDVQVVNSSGNGSNGSHFIIEDSTVDFSDNGAHGLSAGELSIANSTVTANGNKGMGIAVGNALSITDHSTVTVTDNATNASYGYAGMRLYNDYDFTVDATSKLYIKDNHNTGLYVRRGNLTVEEGATLEITGNSVSNTLLDGYGGGVYVGYDVYYDPTVVLPSDAVICNNHATAGGDDLYVSEGVDGPSLTFYTVGSDWVLDDCDDAINGWYDDSPDARWSAHAKPLHAVEFTDFDHRITTVSGPTYLKAAHDLIPVEPDDPDLPDWEISKSKTATNLDDNYTSQVTLSLPAAQETLESDVVFVLDKSTSADVEEQMISMLSDLNEQAEATGATINVGVVIFNKTANSVLPLTRLSTENMGAIQAAIETDISSGTNTHAGLLAGKAMLDEDTSVDANRKYLIFVSDGITYMFDEPAQAINSQQATTGEYAIMAGNDCWGIRHYLEGKDSYIPADWTSYLTDAGAHLDDVAPYIQPYGSMSSDICIPRGDTELPTTVDVALYKTWQTYQQMQASGYHCYAVTADTGYADTYPWGPAFMSYLSGDKDVSFADIQNDIYYLLDAGSKVVDVMGYGTDNHGNAYDFDFVNDISALKLTVNGETLPAQEIDVTDAFFTGSHETACYVFGYLSPRSMTSGYPYALHYYANGQDGQSDECFVWEINVPVSNFAPVELTYSVKLANPQTADGTYGQFDADGSEHYDSLLTNLSAALYPVDSNGEQGMPETFAKPTVSYTITTPGGDGGNDEGGDDDDDDDGGTNIPDDDTPTTDIPDVDTPTTDIPDENTPTTDVPGTDLEDPDVPLADVPKTGDVSALWLALSALSGTGLAGVTFLGRKKHDEE